MVHVNPDPRLPERALAMVYNPLDVAVHRTLTLPLYYSGLTGSCVIRREEGPAAVVPLDAKSQAELQVDLAPRSRTWFLVGPAAAPAP
jgi:hypothetical protein